MKRIFQSFLTSIKIKKLYPPGLFPYFPKHTEFASLVPVWCVTPGTGGVIHRFFDTSPFSPSGRYLALTRLPFEDHLPGPGDVAEIVLVDLDTGEQRMVAETRGWDTQLGAQVQWGADDTQLFFNDVDIQTWRAFGVKLDPFSKQKTILDGTIYMVSPDGNWVVSPCLLRIGMSQAGYGVIVPPDKIPLNQGAPRDDGIFVTNTLTGQSKLLISLQEIVERLNSIFDNDEYRDGDFYGFHVKWNPQGTRLMFVLRWLSRHKGIKRRNNLLTMRADGSDLHLAVSAAEWAKGGHHPNWCPDGENIIMNLNVYGDGLRFIQTRYDGESRQVLADSILGSGHPTLHPNGRHILTDAYLGEPVAFGNGTVPIRLIDLQNSKEKTLVRISTNPSFKGPNNELRVDPHPAWDHDFRFIAFNGYADDVRRVYIADLTNVLC